MELMSQGIENIETNEDNRFLEVLDTVENGDIVLNSILMRHGPKKSAVGEKDDLSSEFDRVVLDSIKKYTTNIMPEDIVHITASPRPRAVATQTAVSQEINNYVNTMLKNNTNEKLSTAFYGENEDELLMHDLHILQEVQVILEGIIKEDEDIIAIENEHDRKTAIGEKIDRIILSHFFSGDIKEFIINLGESTANELPSDISSSTASLSQNLEDKLLRYRNHLGLFQQTKKEWYSNHISSLKDVNNEDIPEFKRTHTPYTQIDISHSYPIMCFIKQNMVFLEDNKIIEAKELSSDEFFRRVGGAIVEADSICISYIKKDSSVVMKLQGDNFIGYII